MKWEKVVDYLTTTDAHKIGILYLTLSIINLVLAGLMAFLIRLVIAVTPPGARVEETGIATGNLYYWFVSLHGLAMLLLFAMQAVVGMANVAVPKLIGAPDLYWPRINALSFWLQVPATVLMWGGLFFAQQGAGPGWTIYPPFSTGYTLSLGVDLVLMGIIVGGISSTLSGINFILTITRLRRPDIKMLDMSLFAWSVLAMSILMVAALPPLAVGAVMQLLDRHLGFRFFAPNPSNPAAGGDPRLWQHIFWFFGHPEVYILVLPAMGLVSEVLQRMAGRRAYGYTAIALSSVAIAAISFAVWVHHMFTAVQDWIVRVAFAVATMAVAIPSGVKVFNWVATLYGARIRLRAPMLFTLTFIAFFIVGGVTGVFFPVVPVDLHLQDTYFVLGHFHYVVNAITLGVLGALLYYYPHITGRWYDERLARMSWGLLTVGGGLTYTMMLAAGVLGMPRRYAASPTGLYYPYHVLMTVGSWLIAAGVALYLINLLWSYFNGRPVKNREDPWGAAKMGLPDVVEPAFKSPHVHTPWPALVGLAALPLSLGVLNILASMPTSIVKGVAASPQVGWAMVGLFVAFGLAWFKSDMWNRALAMRFMNGAAHGYVAIPKPPSVWGDLRVTMAWVIFSEAVLFLTLISSAYYARVVLYGQWNAALQKAPDLLSPLAIAMSIALWGSSFTAVAARRAFTAGDVRRFYMWIGATMAMGAFFAGSQFLVEYPTLMHEGFVPTATIHSMYFYSIVTLHGFHVLIGLTFWALVLLLVKVGYWTPKRPDGVEAAEYYWHFVDGIWVLVFSTFYLGAVNAIPPPAALHA
ncbi:cbb3-type cytochrome c oxidase subunit I [Pyrobaculum ferrireducens]|uniref:Cytochrome C oxidase subunit I /III n=1 Tax=Pyrobaculum ferrireducens TaxID=1104324 RepID=G7VAH4_9CREN|nr:cbb3-type cytochrome c oxidase subunit I [Pyrobaculum ferrireducens]AET32213.1 cytochrome C oxidase subunit I /III [Pyrobaculum ferrireducens]